MTIPAMTPPDSVAAGVEVAEGLAVEAVEVELVEPSGEPLAEEEEELVEVTDFELVVEAELTSVEVTDRPHDTVLSVASFESDVM